MKSKLQNRKQNGFTIIEVLIVLAIAGLIMLIVFLAVPALQRNQRNNARKNDVSRIGGAVSEFYSNNNGTSPTTTAHRDQIVSSAGTMSNYNDNGDITLSAGGANNPVKTITNGPDSMTIYTGSKCTTGGSSSTTGASPRQSVIHYAVETNGAATSICQDI
jgi:prepilin-type N-terminal cleavage/methylation domain-containing protein